MQIISLLDNDLYFNRYYFKGIHFVTLICILLRGVLILDEKCIIKCVTKSQNNMYLRSNMVQGCFLQLLEVLFPVLLSTLYSYLQPCNDFSVKITKSLC